MVEIAVKCQLKSEIQSQLWSPQTDVSLLGTYSKLQLKENFQDFKFSGFSIKLQNFEWRLDERQLNRQTVLEQSQKKERNSWLVKFIRVHCRFQLKKKWLLLSGFCQDLQRYITPARIVRGIYRPFPQRISDKFTGIYPPWPRCARDSRRLQQKFTLE